MSDYIEAADVKSFNPGIAELQSAGESYLEDNIIARTKIAIDKHCFRNFEDADTSSIMYAEIQLAQKMLSVKLFIREMAEPKKAKETVGKGGGESKGDWTYNIGDIGRLIEDDTEIMNILEEYRDWSKSERLKPKTGKMLLEGDPDYDSRFKR